MNPDGFEVSKEGRCDGGQGRLAVSINDFYLLIIFLASSWRLNVEIFTSRT